MNLSPHHHQIVIILVHSFPMIFFFILEIIYQQPNILLKMVFLNQYMIQVQLLMQFMLNYPQIFIVYYHYQHISTFYHLQHVILFLLIYKYIHQPLINKIISYLIFYIQYKQMTNDVNLILVFNNYMVYQNSFPSIMCMLRIPYYLY